MKNEYKIENDICIVYIKRNNGEKLEMIIDAEDLPKLDCVPNTIFAQWSNFTNSFYAICNTKGGYKIRKRIHIHRIISNCPDNLVVDHINHDTLDNRKCNLRNVTRSENSLNTRVYTRYNPFKNKIDVIFRKECRPQKPKKIRPQKPKKERRKGLRGTEPKSGVRGLYWDKRVNKWRARIRIKHKTLFEKYFSDKEEAINMLDIKFKELLPNAS